MWQDYNPNPNGHRVGDCTVRAIAAALGMTWGQAYLALSAEGFALGDMPSANRTWGAFLEKNGFKRKLTEADCSTCYTVRDFCNQHPKGTYVLAISGHTVCCKNGDWWDSWDSGSEVPIYYWERSDN